ncbi:MAG: hypothetical protein FJ298_00020 [Planctomycetes bacterium]|nr:hypothetical protein [Planctomycetota bacterium]
MTLWLGLFLWTLVLELPIYEFAAARRSSPWWHLPLVVLALNLLTHPLFTWWHYEAAPARDAVFVAELWITLAEGLALFALRRELGLGRALLASFAANGVSYGSGLFVGWLLA